MFGHVRLITFDLDDTLWPCQPVIRAAEVECYAWLEGEAPRLTARYTPEQLREHRIGLGRQHPEIAHDMTEIRLRSLAALLEDEGYPIELACRASDVFRAARNRVTPFDDVAGALSRLRCNYTLVSVTNGNSQVAFTPLHASFDHSLTAAEVGAAKPDPAIFHAASERSGIPLPAFLHVGDDPRADVQAARNLGLSTVWVNRDGRDWPNEVEPADLEVADIAALAERLIR
jgi:putative hydrolase of the HAD superfamily